MNLKLLEGAVLTHGAHWSTDGTCARELIYLVVTGEKKDRTPECLTATLSALPVLNDGPWRDDAHRTSVLLPYLRRLLDCPRDYRADRQRAFALVDYAERVIDQLNSLPVIEGNLETEYIRLESIRAAKEAAGTAAKSLLNSGVDLTAVWAAWAIRSAARAGQAEKGMLGNDFEIYVRRFLEIICS